MSYPNHNEGIFNSIKVNKTVKETLLKLHTKRTNQQHCPAKWLVRNSHSFLKLTKKMKLFYLVNVLNKLKNQIVKYNVKRLFQIWHLYHRDNRIIATIVNILFKTPQYDIEQIRQEMLHKNRKGGKYKKHRDEICQKISENANLLRLFDRKNVKYCLDNFAISLAKLKKNIPIIMGFNECDIDKLIHICLYEKTFPFYLLPHTIAKAVKQLLTNRLPRIDKSNKKRDLQPLERAFYE